MTNAAFPLRGRVHKAVGGTSAGSCGEMEAPLDRRSTTVTGRVYQLLVVLTTTASFNEGERRSQVRRERFILLGSDVVLLVVIDHTIADWNGQVVTTGLSINTDREPVLSREVRLSVTALHVSLPKSSMSVTEYPPAKAIPDRQNLLQSRKRPRKYMARNDRLGVRHDD